MLKRYAKTTQQIWKKQEQANFRVNWLLSLRRFFDSFIWERIHTCGAKRRRRENFKILIYVRRFRNFWSKFSNGATLGATMKWGILGAKSSHWGQMSPMGEILNSGIPAPHPSANVRKIKHWICHQNPNFLKPPSDIQISKSFGETKKCSYFWLRTEPLRS